MNPDLQMSWEEFKIKYKDVFDHIDTLSEQQQYIISLHLDIHPYDTMPFDQKIIAIKQHCGIKS